MIDINELRRLAQAASPGPDGVSLSWITFLQDFQQSANPAAISELLDRLEAAESECLEQARLNGMGSEREAALMAKLEVAEKEVEIERMRLAACGVAALGYFEGCAEEYISASLNDVLALRAKIEAMEKQEPVMWANASNIVSARINQERGTIGDQHTCAETKTAYHDAPLYALPGAQPAPSVPTGFVWPECPKRRQSHVLFDDGYEEGWAVCVATIKAVLAVAPEAKP